MKRTGAKNKEFSWQDTGEKIAMGERVGKILESLQETACVHMEERESIATIKMFAKLFEKDADKDIKDFIEYLQTSVIPALKELGYGRWYRDVITDLALAMAKKGRSDKTHVKVDAKKLLS